MDHFTVLGVSRDASRADVRSAYHRLMLKHHPDKRDVVVESPHVDLIGERIGPAVTTDETVSRLNEAYRVLSDESSRRAYVKALEGQRGSGGMNGHALTKTRQDRPMRIISLSEFTPHDDRSPSARPTASTMSETDSYAADAAAEADSDAEPTRFTHPCRCSATLEITLQQLEDGVDVVGCEGCGERVGVGYEVVEEEGDPSHHS